MTVLLVLPPLPPPPPPAPLSFMMHSRTPITRVPHGMHARARESREQAKSSVFLARARANTRRRETHARFFGFLFTNAIPPRDRTHTCTHARKRTHTHTIALTRTTLGAGRWHERRHAGGKSSARDKKPPTTAVCFAQFPPRQPRYTHTRESTPSCQAPIRQDGRVRT